MSEQISIDYKKCRMTGTLHVMIIKDHDFLIHYIPSLKLSAYGTTNEEAGEMLKTTINEYLVELFKLPEFEIKAELMKFGWKRQKFFHKIFDPPVYVDKEGVLRDFNLPMEALINEEVVSI